MKSESYIKSLDSSKLDSLSTVRFNFKKVVIESILRNSLLENSTLRFVR